MRFCPSTWGGFPARVRDVPHRSQIWRYFDGLGRAHQECGASRREVARRRPPGCRGAVGHGGRDQSPAGPGARDFARAGRPRARHDRRHRRAGQQPCWPSRCRPKAWPRAATPAGRCPCAPTRPTKARITSIDDARIRADLDAGRVVIVTGFQGVDADGHITTLGRGGSDTSAVAVAAAIKADECLIYTDVDGVYTTRASCPKRAAWRRVVRGNARDGLAGLQGPADPLGRIRRQIPCADAGAVLADRPAHPARRRNAFGHADYF